LLKENTKEPVKRDNAVIKRNKPYTTKWPNIGNPEMETRLTETASTVSSFTATNTTGHNSYSL